MRRALSAIIVALATVVACARASGPLAPPANLGPTVTPRFDGVYGAPVKGTNGGRDIVRFTDNGQVFGMSAVTEAAAKKAESFVRDGNQKCARGTWTVTDGVLRFSLRSTAGVVDYAGSVQGDRLTLKWRSAINGASEDGEYAFGAGEVKPVSAADAGVDAGPVDAGVEPADAEAPLIPGSLVPEGTGWFCFKAGSASRCERKLAACESARRTATAVRKDAKAAKCTRQTNAWCFTVQRAGGLGAASCTSVEADCDAERTSVTAETDAAEVVVGACSRQ